MKAPHALLVAALCAAAALIAACPAAAQEIDLDGPLTAAHTEGRREIYYIAPDRLPAPPREYGVGEAEMYLRLARGVAPSAGTPVTSAGTVGLSGRALLGDRAGYGVGGDLEIGASDRGLAGHALVYPFGAGVAIGSTGFAGIFGGVGGGGWGYAPAGVELPVEARIIFDVSARVRLGAGMLFMWVPGVEARRGGAPHLPFCDEARIGASVQIGHLWDHDRLHDSGGYFFRIEHAEMLGTSFLGLSIGYRLSGSG
jgi:hypothetical protein